ncbi:hypothetical protein C8A00DRAFT_14585 [Chaetomidium leptoderma]|uniref:Uncharacterized protein n=1 Tax=Chaetomidium leptoderma TaxID=669021 RepID=A0AAN6VMG6_9PEZI|nr:hypothetical protein C8A00DRAFT_14585 [Chaetomidium leptoderma]
MSSIAPSPITSPSAVASSLVPSASTASASVESAKEDDEDVTIRFTDIQSLFQTINSTTGDILLVTDVSPSSFAKIEREREKRGRAFRFRRYNSDSRTLIIIILTKLHEQLHLGLYHQFHYQLFQTGMHQAWRSMGSATLRRQGHPAGDAGEGDSTGLPDPERIGMDDWPTLVIEAGDGRDSESLNWLRDDMRWWFLASNHDVKIIMLAKFDHRRRHILLERWEEQEWHPQGAMTRNRAAIQQQRGLVPILRQEITITRDAKTNPVSYNVTRGALVLGFKLLFLRDPGPGEGDFVISVRELQKYAERVWSYVRA